jgi:hypothetical protein
LVEVGIGTGVGDGVGVGVGVGVGLCAQAGGAADSIATTAKATAIAVTIRRIRASPIVCRIPEGCDGQLMTTIPETKWRSAKMPHGLRHV